MSYNELIKAMGKAEEASKPNSRKLLEQAGVKFNNDGKIVMDLSSQDGKYFGSVSYNAYKAIEGNTLDSYKPKDKEEESIISNFRNHTGIAMKSADGKEIGKVSYDGYTAILNNNLDGYTPKNDSEKTVIETIKKEPILPFTIEIDNEKKDFGKISYNAYKAIENGTIVNYTPVNDSEKKAINNYVSFVEAYAKKQREPENLGQGLLHGAGYTIEKVGAGAVNAPIKAGQFVEAGVAKLLSIPAWGNWEKALNDYAGRRLSTKTIGDQWNESAEERYRVPDWYRNNVGSALSSMGELAPAFIAEVYTMGVSPLLDAQLASKAAMTATTATKGAKVVNQLKNSVKTSDYIFGLSAAGSSAKAGYAISGDVGKALNYGVLNGLGEVATEKLFGGFAGTNVGDSAFDWKKLVNNKYIRKGLDFGSEAVEEMIMTGADYFFQKATVNPEVAFASAKDFGESAFQGILLSVLMGGVNTTIQKGSEKTSIYRLNKYAKALNATITNEADKIGLLKYNSSIEEIKDKQRELQNVTSSYARVLENEILTNNTEEEIQKEVERQKDIINSYEADTEQNTATETPTFEQTTPVVTDVEMDVVGTTPQTDGVSTDVYNMLVGEKLTNKAVDNIISTPELRDAFEQLTGIEIKGTKAEQRAIVRNAAKNLKSKATTTDTVAPQTPQTTPSVKVGDVYVSDSKGATYTIVDRGADNTTVSVKYNNGDTVTKTTSNAEFDNTFFKTDGIVKIETQNVPTTAKSVFDNKEVANKGVETTNEEISLVVDAMNETLREGAEEGIYEGMPPELEKSLDTFAKSLIKAYNKVGNIGNIAKCFSDGGKKVISAIESILTKSTLNNKTVVETKQNTEEVLQNQSKSATIKEKATQTVPDADKSHTVAYTNDNERIELKFKVVSVDDLVVSNSLDGKVNPNYPQELQPRDRSRTSSQSQIRQLAANLNPARLEESTSVSEGSPIVGPDNVVESGNGRTLAIELAYKNGTADEYRKHIVNNADQYGIDVSNLPERPVLVRERLTEVDRTEFTRKANESSIGSLSATEQAKVDAEKLTVDVLNLLVANDDGIINTSDNHNFISAVITKVFKNEDLNNVVGADGRLSARGLERITNAIFYKAYGDASLSARLSESLDNDMKNATKVLLNIAPRIVSIKNGIASGNIYDFDFSTDIVSAIKLFEKCRNQSTTLENYAAQESLFEKESELTLAMAYVFETKNRGAKQGTDFYNLLLDTVEELGNPNQISLDIMETFKTKEEIFDVTVEKFNNRVEPKNALTIPENIYRPESKQGREDDRRGIDEVSGNEPNKNEKTENAVGVQHNNRRSKETGVVANDEQLRQTNESVKRQSEVEREDNGNEHRREGLFYENGKRRNNGSSRKQTERLLSFRRGNQGKDATERQNFARDLIERGQVEEVSDKNARYTLVKPEAYNDDMLSMVEDAKSKGVELRFFVGGMDVVVELDDGTKTTKTMNGLKINSTQILVQYDDVAESPQQLYRHEYCHAKWNTPEMRKIKNTILNSLSENDRKNILSSQRFRDYIKAYKGNMNIVWEEFVCDVMSGKSHYTANYIDVVTDYWYGNETVDSYSPADYTTSTDAGGKNTERYSFAGKKADTADLSKLDEAKKMLEQGLAKEDVLKQTGWFKGADGKWRFEIDDSNSKFLFEKLKQETTLENVWKNDDVYKAYPFLKNIKIKTENFGDESHKYGEYNALTNTLSISDEVFDDDIMKHFRDEFEQTIIHEVQHAIQFYEGFELGGSPDEMLGYLRLKAHDYLANATDDKLQQILANGSIEELNKYVDDFIVNQFGAKDIKDASKKAYFLLHGEKEAFAAEKRMSLTAKERREIYPNYGKGAVLRNEVEKGNINDRVSATSERIPESEFISYLYSDSRRGMGEESGMGEELRASRISETKDQDYLKAVESGDVETAQKMVDDAAKANGYNIKAYHGTKRADRVGTVFRPDRATSGPMAYFTDSKEIASNYARDKADTSLAYDEEYDSYYTQFRVNRGGKSISIPELWKYLSISQKNKIKEIAGHIKFDDDYENIIVDKSAKYGNGAYDAYTLNMHRGNVLETLVDTWLETGDLYNREADFLEVLRLVGIEDAEYKDPDARQEKVYDTWLKIQNPFATDFADRKFYDSLSNWIESHDMSVYEKETSNADWWDKNNQTPDTWLEKLSYDIENSTTHAWTVIPDFVTDYLKEQRFDGIKDKGGKGGGDGHTVWIPFSSEQIKSAEPVTYDDNGNVIPLAERFNAENNDIRYSLKDEINSLPAEDKKIVLEARHRAIYSRSIATMSEDRLSKAYSEYSDSNPSTTSGYLAYIEPLDFISLTTTSIDAFLKQNPQKLNEGVSKDWGTENNIQNSGELYLKIDDDGNVVGHEGRHRMAGLFREGVDRVAIIIKTSQVDNAKPISIKKLSGQDFGNTKSYSSVYVHNMLPISKEYENINKHIFGDVAEGNRFVEPNIRYSIADYAPTFYSQMGKTIDEMKQEKIGANSVVSYLKGKGVKNEEIKWSGIETFLDGKKSVTKAELQEFVANNQLQIEETVLDGSQSTTLEIQEVGRKDLYVMRGGEVYDSLTWLPSESVWMSDAYGFYFDSMPRIRNYYGVNENGTRWGDYKLGGGENYREIIFKMPNSDYTNQAMRTHWGDNANGILAHARLQDFDVAGKKMLFIEEIQSDWHNEGASKGYKKKLSPTEEKIVIDITDKRTKLFNELQDVLQEIRKVQIQNPTNQAEATNHLWAKANKLRAEERSLKEEAETIEGAEKSVPDAPFRNNYHEYVLKNLIRMAAEQGYDSIGWTTADIQSKRWSEQYAEGYRIEYDQDIPKFLNKYGKKWGAKVGREWLTLNEDLDEVNVWSMDITDSMKDAVLYEGQARYSLATDGILDLEDLWTEAIEEYGTIPKGEIPARDVDVPKKINKKDVVSRFARTMIEAGVTPDETVSEFEKAILDGTMTHEVITNKNASERAKHLIKHLGFEDALKQWSVLSDSGKVGKNELALGMELYNQCITNKDVHNAMKIAAELVAEATRAGQTLQATRMLKRMTPDGQLYYLEKSIQKMNEEFKEKLGEKYKDIELDEELMEEFLTEKDEKKRNEIYDKVCQNIADQIPATQLDKWNSWRYLAMLGNSRTHLRNIFGNAVFIPSLKLKNYIGAVMEKAAKVNTSDRTKSLRKSKEAVKFAKKDVEEMIKVLQGENAKYAVTSDIQGKRTIFKTRWLEKLRLKNFDFLEREDMWFLKYHYTDALARLITARNIDVNSITPQMLEQLRAYAVKEAQAATYRDANALAEGLNRLQKTLEHSDKKTIKASGILLEGIMPFKKTPMNIAKQGINYSPVGILKGVYNALTKLKAGETTVTDVIDDLSKGLSGTMVMMLGYFLASMGWLGGDEDKTQKEKEFDKMVGEQSYALNIGDVFSYTIDWMTPSNLSLFIGAKLHDLTKDDFEFADVVGALSTVTEPLLELSVFSGLNGVIESAQYSDSEALLAIGSDMITSYLMQGLPTIGGQISRIVDQSKREYYYTDKNSVLPQGLQRLIGQASSKIPFASYLFQPAIDEWGREEKYGNIVERVLENTVSPGYYSAKNYTEVDKELKELHERTGDDSVLPVIQQKKYTEDSVNYYMRAENYTETKKIRGQKSFELVSELLSDKKSVKLQNKKTNRYQNKRYSQMSDDEKVRAIKKCYEEAGDYTKEQMLEKVKSKAK